MAFAVVRSHGGALGGVFINYRKGAHTSAVEALYGRLARHFGAEQVFLDMSSIDVGARYPDVLRREVGRCDVLLAVIHPGWLTDGDAAGQPRIAREDDWVRREIAQALHAGKTVVPVLLPGAAQPRREELPTSISELALRQRAPIRQGSFEDDVDTLIRRVEQHVSAWTPPDQPASRESPSPARWTGLLVGVVSGVAAAVPVLAAGDDRAPVNEPPWQFTMALWSAVVMVAWLVATGVPAVLWVRVNVWERMLQPVPASRYVRWFAFPVCVAWIAFCDVIIYRVTGSAYFVALVSFLAVVYMGWLFIRSETLDEEDEANWPLPSTDPSPATLRRALARLHRRLESWQRPLSREQRDKAAWAMHNLSAASQRLREHAQQSRIGWLRADYRAAAGYLIWASLTCGLFWASVRAATTGPLGARQYLASLAFLLTVTLIGGATAELTYRYQRRQRRALADEIDKQCTEYDTRLHASQRG